MNVKDSNLNEKNSYEKKYQKNYQESQENDQESNMSINFVEFDDQKNELYYKEISVNSEKKYETFAEFVEIEASCITCKKVFSFSNKLHKHLKNCKPTIRIEKIKKSAQKKISEKSIMIKSIIVKSTVFTAKKNYELVFRKWNYVEALIKLKSNLQTNDDYVCLNIDIDAFLTNKQFVLKRLLKIHIHLMISSLTIRNIEANVHEIKKYVNFSKYLSSKNDSTRLIEIHREMHLVKELKVNMLIDNDILKSKDIIIDVQHKKTTIRSCDNLTIEIKIHQRESFVRRNVINQFVNIISSEAYVKISYKMKNLFSNRDFLFESSSEVSIFIYAHVINARITDVIVRNESAKSMKISRNFKLKVAQKIQYDDCFHVSQKHHLTLQTS
jgi:hypothetical protein